MYRTPSEYPDTVGRVTSAQAFAEHAHKSYGNDVMRASGRKQVTSFEYVDPRPVNVGVGGVMPGQVRYAEIRVELLRHQSGFGFRIVGGTEEGSQVINSINYLFNTPSDLMYLV